MKVQFSEAQILGFLREAAAGTPVIDLCWNYCFSRSTFRVWKAKYGATIEAEAGRLKQLELENARLRKALARASSDVVRMGRLSTIAVVPSAHPKSNASYRPAYTPSHASALHDAIGLEAK
jgi:putative transposase